MNASDLRAQVRGLDKEHRHDLGIHLYGTYLLRMFTELRFPDTTWFKWPLTKDQVPIPDRKFAMDPDESNLNEYFPPVEKFEMIYDEDKGVTINDIKGGISFLDDDVGNTSSDERDSDNNNNNDNNDDNDNDNDTEDFIDLDDGDDDLVRKPQEKRTGPRSDIEIIKEKLRVRAVQQGLIADINEKPHKERIHIDPMTIMESEISSLFKKKIHQQIIKNNKLDDPSISIEFDKMKTPDVLFSKFKENLHDIITQFHNTEKFIGNKEASRIVYPKLHDWKDIYLADSKILMPPMGHAISQKRKGLTKQELDELNEIPSIFEDDNEDVQDNNQNEHPVNHILVDNDIMPKLERLFIEDASTHLKSYNDELSYHLEHEDEDAIDSGDEPEPKRRLTKRERWNLHRIERKRRNSTGPQLKPELSFQAYMATKKNHAGLSLHGQAIQSFVTKSILDNELSALADKEVEMEDFLIPEDEETPVIEDQFH